jgi:hypothetical protein
MTNTDSEIDNMPAGAELDMLIETEIFGCIPLSDEEWDLCKAMMEHRDPHMSPPSGTRLVLEPLPEPTYLMKLPFRLIWPRCFSRENFGSYSRTLVQKMREDGWLYSLHDGITSVGETYKLAQFVKQRQATQEEIEDGNAYGGMTPIRGEGLANTDALATAIAALRAVRELKKSVENIR